MLPCVLEPSPLQGELAHRLVKRLYGLTNKKDASEQIARRYRRAHRFGASGSRDPSPGNPPPLDGNRTTRDDSADDPPELHHTTTNSRNNPVQLASFSKTQDPAAKVGPHGPFTSLPR